MLRSSVLISDKGTVSFVLIFGRRLHGNYNHANAVLLACMGVKKNIIENLTFFVILPRP